MIIWVQRFSEFESRVFYLDKFYNQLYFK